MRNHNDQRVKHVRKPRLAASKKQSSDVSRPNARIAYERYMTLAKAAAAHGDTVESEGLFQRAEHYLRLSRSPDD